MRISANLTVKDSTINHLREKPKQVEEKENLWKGARKRYKKGSDKLDLKQARNKNRGIHVAQGKEEITEKTAEKEIRDTIEENREGEAQHKDTANTQHNNTQQPK